MIRSVQALTVITPPDPVVSLDQAKRHLRIDHPDDDEYITGLLEVATGWIDGPSGWLGRALGEQVLEARFPAAVDAAQRAYPYPPFVALVSDVPQPDGCSSLVRWKAGYPKTQEGKSTVPAPIRHAILLMVSHLFNNRDAVTTTAAQPATLPMGVEALLAPYRMWRV